MTNITCDLCNQSVPSQGCSAINIKTNEPHMTRRMVIKVVDFKHATPFIEKTLDVCCSCIKKMISQSIPIV